MRIKYKRAFSLTELLIVLAIIAILFAAATPIVTRRAKADFVANEPVWQFLKHDPEISVFFDSGIRSWDTCAFIGRKAENNCGKFAVHSNNANQIQLRYSPTTNTRMDGVPSAYIKLDNSDNLFFGANYNSLGSHSRGNTIVGLNTIAPGHNTTLQGATFIGNYVAKGGSFGTQFDANAVYGFNIFVGNNAGTGAQNLSDGRFANIYIGESAGSGAAGFTNNNHNIAIGSKAMSVQTHGDKNVFIGAEVGNSFGANDTAGTASNNVIIGSRFTGGKDNNTIIGYGSYHKQGENTSNMTVIGYDACDVVNPNSNSSFACIGYKSGSTGKYFNNNIENSGQHIYLGGPSDLFGGRAPLEIHHSQASAYGTGTVVLNSNLVVKGDIYPSQSGRAYTLTREAAVPGDYNYCNSDEPNSNFLGRNAYICRQANSKWTLHPTYKRGAQCKNGYERLGSCLSDERLKDNIILNNDGLEQVLSLVPYNYTFKSDKTKTPQVGVIAQDLQKVFPSSVTKGKDGFLSIRWDEMFYAVINAIKTLSAKIETVAADLFNMENDVKYLKSANKNAKTKISALNRSLNNLEKKYRSNK